MNESEIFLPTFSQPKYFHVIYIFGRLSPTWTFWSRIQAKMRSPTTYRRNRRSPVRHRRNASPIYRDRSPQREPQVDPKKIKITLPILNDKGGQDTTWRLDTGIVMEDNCRRISGRGFESGEEEVPRQKALRKIQIEIRRNIKNPDAVSSPIRRTLKPYDVFVIPRRPGKSLSWI